MSTLLERAAPTASPAPPRGHGWFGALRALVVLGTVVAVFLALGWWPLLVFIVSLVVIVMLHELGHFLAAKWSHMKVTQYFVGFGPTLWSFRRGETEYGVKPILAGGFVKIPGMSSLEDIDPADEASTYRQQPFSKRIFVSLAGPLVHLVLGFLLAWVALMAYGVQSNTVSDISVAGFSHWSGYAETAAQRAGLKVGDQIVSVGGHAITSPDQFASLISKAPGRTLPLVVERGGHDVTLEVTPARGSVSSKTGREVLSSPGSHVGHGVIGISTESSPAFTAEGPVRATGTAIIELGSFVSATVSSIPHGVAAVFKQISSAKAATAAQHSADDGGRLTSIVGIGHLSILAERSGMLTFLRFLILINIALGVLNLLPMLPFDGGYIAISIYERIRTRRGQPYFQADITKLFPVVAVFVTLVLVIVLAATYLDITHPFGAH
jgi:membrane-associated protease RseP (regulator of RpoE activity)